MATRKVVYDDQDSQAIQYSGQWFEKTVAQDDIGNYGPPYLHTLHGTNNDASISFEFDGTDIGVYGTSILSNPKTEPDPTLECFIDGVSIGREPPFEFPENNWKLCGKGGLSAGPHKLQIDIRVRSAEQTFWLDQIRYIPSPSMPLDNKMILLTNTDPAIQLDSNWESFANFKATKKSNAVAHVDFIGISVSWVGYIPKELSHGSAFGTYSIDDGKPVNFNLAGLPGKDGPSVYNQVFFTTPEVENGHHTLTVTFLGSESTTPLTLDSLYIKNGTLLIASPSESPNSSTANTSASNLQTTRLNGVTDSNIISTVTNMNTITGAITVTSVGSVGNPSVTQNPNIVTNSGSVNDGGESGLNIGALLGGILGGLGLSILIAGAFLYRRRRRLSRGRMVQPFKGEPGVSIPFNSYSDFPSTAGLNDRPIPNTTAQAAYGNVPLPANRPSAKRREAFGVETQPINSSHDRSDSAGSSAWQRTVSSGTGEHSGRVHTDSGVRLNQLLVEDIPPHYTVD